MFYIYISMPENSVQTKCEVFQYVKAVTVEPELLK